MSEAPPIWWPDVSGDEDWELALERGLVKVCPRCGYQYMDAQAHVEECAGGTLRQGRATLARDIYPPTKLGGSNE